MNNAQPSETLDYVPEVDAQALKSAVLPQADDTTAPDVAPATATSPEDALKRLPPEIAAHIQDLIAQADAEGYLRGRNEQIEATQHFDDTPDDTLSSAARFPVYNRRSIWD